MSDTLQKAYRKQALEAIRQAGDAVEAAHWLGFIASEAQPKLDGSARVQRGVILSLSSKLVESKLDELMDAAVGSWKLYKEALSASTRAEDRMVR